MEFKEILKAWNLEFKTTHPELVFYGSPRRALSRYVVETNKGLFLLEKIDNPEKKEKIAEIIGGLNIKKINPYIRTNEGRFILDNNGFWRISKYIQGVPLKRPYYLRDEWRGDVLIEFIKQLKQKNIEAEKFSLKEFIKNFKMRLMQNNPELLQKLGKALDFLNGYIKKELPNVFSHGDFHPMNIIWSNDDILAVIDWEFTGLKPMYYDEATMVGSLSFEYPDAIINDITLNFIKEIKDKELLFESVIATRMVWLSQWLNMNDKSMIELECEHINLLIAKQHKILEYWNQKLF